MICSNCSWRTGETKVLSYSQAALRLLKTNDWPTPCEEAQIRADMACGTENLSLIEKEISMLQQKLADLEQKRQALSRFVDDHKSIFSTFGRVRLPPEIMTNIFRNVSGGNVCTKVMDDIWVCGRVCSYWRNVLLACPLLWNNISIYEDRTDVVEELLSRSKRAPLDIRVQILSPAISLMSVLAGVSERWRSILLMDIPEAYFNTISSPVRGRVPWLEEFQIYHTRFSTTFDWLSDAPSLRKVTFAYCIGPVLNLDLPWSQLRGCNVPLITAEDQLQLLQQCPSLETLIVREYPGSHYATNDEFFFPDLRILEVTLERGTPWLSNLVVPSLTDVKFFSFQNSTITDLKHLVQRSSCLIQRLEVNVRGDTWIRARQLLSEVPFHALTHLRLPGSFVCRPVTDALTLRLGNSHIILPCLQHLSIGGPSRFLQDADNTDDTKSHFVSLLEMTVSRWYLEDEFRAIVSRLMFLKVDIWDSPSRLPVEVAGILAPLQILGNEGLQVDVHPYLLNPLIR